MSSSVAPVIVAGTVNAPPLTVARCARAPDQISAFAWESMFRFPCILTDSVAFASICWPERAILPTGVAASMVPSSPMVHP